MDFIDQLLECGSLIETAQDSVLVGWGKREWMSHPETSHTSYFYFPDFFLKHTKPWFVHEHSCVMPIQELVDLLGARTAAPRTFQWQVEGKDVFSDAFQQLSVKFRSGELLKAVPYVFETASGKVDKPWLRQLLRSVLVKARIYPIHPYGFWNATEGMLGGTPETLFKIDKGEKGLKFTTVACAGTATKDQGELLLQDPKELHEHELVIKGMQESLQPFGTITREKSKILSLSSLCHLVTPLSVDLKINAPFIKFVEALHPTPALGAFPRLQGHEWLQNYQIRLDRGRYGAPVGCYFPAREEGRCYVAIRNLQWNEPEIRIGVGCGVVQQSHYEKEWKEIQLKTQSIKYLFEI